jgi:hypothetical protein
MVSVEALEALVVANADFEAIETSRSVFCPFEATGMIRQEVRHGYFLAYCLDPQRPHGFGSELLSALMRAAAGAYRREGAANGGGITPLDVHLMNFDGAQVRREWKNIDLVAIVPEERLVIPIELKIESDEHSGQLGRYLRLVRDQWPQARGWRHLPLYLTKYGDAASEDGEGWLALHLADIAHEFERVVQKVSGAPAAQMQMGAYLAMLRRHHLPDERLEQLAAKLWSQHKEALEFLMDRRPDDTSKIVSQLFEGREALARQMTQACGLNVAPDDSSPSIVRFAIPAWDSLPDFLTAQGWTASGRILLLELALNRDGSQLRMRFVLGPSTPDVRLRYFQALEKADLPTTLRKTLTPKFTRLTTQSFSFNEDEDDQAAIVAQMLEHAKWLIPKYADALATL